MSTAPESWLTPEEIEAIQHLPRASPYIIRGVQHAPLINGGRLESGCSFQGDYYWHSPSTDELIRQDVRRFVLFRRANPRSIRKAPSIIPLPAQP